MLEDRWKNGKLDEYVPVVEKFIKKQQKQIRQKLGPEASDDQLVKGIIKLLLTHRTLDPVSEMSKQRREIMKELWICGERGDYDHKRITDEWIQKHAPNWRRWSVLIYTFIAVKCALQIYRDLDL